MKALIDTCIVIDVLQNREPFCEAGQKIFYICARNQAECYLTAKSVTDIYYLTHKQTHSEQQTREILLKLLSLFSVLDTAGTDVQEGLLSQMIDYEDAVIAAAAKRNGIDGIVTRNQKDYVHSTVTVYSPEDFVSLVASE